MLPWMEKDKRDSLKRSAFLRSWCLPMTAASVEADEKESEALALFNAVKTMAARQQAGKKD